MAHRINERNAGTWTLDGEPKTRRTKHKNINISASDKALLLAVVEKVIDCMEFDPDVSERGQLHPEAKFTDGGRFMICLSRTQLEQLGAIYQKIQ